MKFLLCLFACCMLCYSTPAKAGANLDGVKIGGALRFNYTYKDWDAANKDKLGDSGLELFRINAKGEIGEMLLSAEYRWYPGYNFIQHGWVGYNFNEYWQGQIGIQQVPFGIQPYASHNFWAFSGAYYLGLEDDSDMGVKALYNDGPLSLAFAFYKNGELGDATNQSRYSVDILNTGTPNDNEETNQGNIRMAYTFTHSDTCSTEIGLSGEYGGIYNNTTEKTGTHWATAGHLVGNYGPWNIQLESILYKNNPKNPAGGNDDVLKVGCFNFPWDIPAEAAVNTFNVAYGLPVDIGPISKLTFYSDNTVITPDKSDWKECWQNVVGCMVSAGPVYTYLDIVSAENMPFVHGTMVPPASNNNDRHTLININVGYYF